MRGGSRNGRRSPDRADSEVRRARADFPQRASTGLVRRYDLLVVEELAVTGPRPNRRYAKRPPDTGRSASRVMLEHKAASRGLRPAAADRILPSSRIRSRCERLPAGKTGSRTRPSCRTPHDRDVDAAKNTSAVGRSAMACGADV